MLGFYTPAFSRPIYNTVYCSSEIPAPLPGCFFAVLTQIRWISLDVVISPLCSHKTFSHLCLLKLVMQTLILPQFPFKKGGASNNPVDSSPKKARPKELPLNRSLCGTPVMGSYIRTLMKNLYNHYVVFCWCVTVLGVVILPTLVQPPKVFKKKLFKTIWRS